MKLQVKKVVAAELGVRALVPFGIAVEEWTYSESCSIDLDAHSKKLGALEKLLTDNKNVRGVGVLLRDLAMWRHALKDASTAKSRTVPQFEDLVTKHLRTVPGHRVYLRESDAVWLPYYVSEVEYFAKRVHSHSTEPEHVMLTMHCKRFGGHKKRKILFYESDCRGMTIVEALAKQQLFSETPELRERYLAEMVRYQAIAPVIGAQFWARGTATTDVDGNEEVSQYDTYQMVREAHPTRVVVDVFYETPNSDRDDDRDDDIATWFWVSSEDQLDDERPEIEVPTHPYLAVFDMSKHLRLRCHVGYLTAYEYDAELATKLVLPTQMKTLVRMLIERQVGAFQDIIKGKSGGAVILLAGPPGVGKTLTAEVYAESEKRALYSVQCSQLGTDPAALEDELLKVFSRATRWNAVLLLDEADVYVHERGRDLLQNAIVGVFLRVLEYQDTVLFLTTNRPGDVDDAIASRCVARLTYPMPSPKEQAALWRVLGDATGAKLSDSTISALVERFSHLSGRAIKNLLKLSLLTGGKEITVDTVTFVEQFQPTRQ